MPEGLTSGNFQRPLNCPRFCITVVSFSGSSLSLQPHVGCQLLSWWSGSEWWEWRQNTKSGAVGQGSLQPLLDRGGAESTLNPVFIPNCRLQDFLRSYLSQDKHCVNHILLNVMDYTDIVQISLFLLQAIPFWASLGNNWQVLRQQSCLVPTQCPKVHAFMIPVILLSGSDLGVCNKAIILKKNMKDNH